MTREPEYPGRTRYHGAEARFYDRKWKGTLSKRRLWGAEVAVIQAIAKAVPTSSMFLDAACGTGRHLPALSSFGVRWVATDISRDMLQQVPSGTGGGIGVVQAELERLPFADASFGYVLCFKLFQLLPMEAACQVLHELARVSSGAIVLELPLSDAAALAPAALSRNRLARRFHRSRWRWEPTVRSMRRLVRRTRRVRTGRSSFFDPDQHGGCRPQGVRSQAPSRLSDIADLATCCGLRIADVQRMGRSRWTVVVLEPIGTHWCGSLPPSRARS